MNRDTGVENRVRTLRKARGLTQHDLAVLLGVTRQTVNAIENGRYDPSLSLAFGIANVFAARVEDVFRHVDRADEAKPWSGLVLKVPLSLETGLAVLRRHRLSDLSAFTRFVMDTESTRYMAFTEDQKTEAGAAALMDAVIASYATDAPIFSLTIADPETDAYLGAVGGAEAGDGAMEIFVTVMREARRRGMAASAVRGVSDYLFETCAATEIWADTVIENVASTQLFEKLGFRNVGPITRAAEDGAFAHREMTGVRYVLTASAHAKHKKATKAK